MRIVLNYLSLLFFLALLTQCGDNSSNEVSRGHRDAIKNECQSDPDEKLCGKEVRLKFKKDGHTYVTFEDLSKEQTNRIKTNCIIEKKYGLVSYNNCLGKNKILALGGELTQDNEDVKITSHTDKIKDYTFHVVAFWKDTPTGGEEAGASGTGVAIDKNLIATNCHVIADMTYSAKEGKQIFFDTIVVKNLLDKKKIGKVEPLENQLGDYLDIDICLLKTKSHLKYVKKKIKYSTLRQTDSVRALGNPLGIEGHTSLGRITALETWNYYMNKPKFKSEDGKVVDNFKYRIPAKIIHHDATIGEGSSGGPLFDVGGNLIGFNTYGLQMGTSGAFSVAISADHIKDVMRKGELTDF